VPYRDIDPTLFAALAYGVMFGMMFGDVAHGLAIVAVGVAAQLTPRGRLARLKNAAPFLIGAGVAATLFGALYGEAFGPTGLVPTLWIRPLDHPQQLLAAGLAVGGVLLAVTFVLSIVNRWREGGPALALYDPSGIAGALIGVGVASVVLGLTTPATWAGPTGVALGLAGAGLAFVGLFVGAGSQAAGLAEAGVEVFDILLRLGSNIVSFTRLAAFGLTHAVLTQVVWDGTVNLWDRGRPATVVGAALLFTIGNAGAFALGALVGAIQALRLEYYELFSRLFVTTGRPFAPWHLPAQRREPS
jgi:V/A-type H+-transporting ATPase subunit I